MPTFDNGWICKSCWKANREHDRRCYRCKEPNPAWQRLAARPAPPRVPRRPVVRPAVGAASQGVRRIARATLAIIRRGVSRLTVPIRAGASAILAALNGALRGARAAGVAIAHVVGWAVRGLFRGLLRGARWAARLPGSMRRGAISAVSTLALRVGASVRAAARWAWFAR